MAKSTTTSLLSARIPITLVERIKTETDRSGETLTEFLIDAIQNECDRRTMTKPRPKVDLVDVLGKIQKVHDLTARLDAQNRLVLANQDMIKIAIGIDTKS